MAKMRLKEYYEKKENVGDEKLMERLCRIEDKLSALETSYRYLQVDMTECKKTLADHKPTNKPPKRQQP